MKKALEVIDFQRVKEAENPSVKLLQNPAFRILILRNDKLHEIELQLRGNFSYITPINLKNFKAEAYKDYNIIRNYLLGDFKDTLIEKWNMSLEEYKELILGLYVVLVKKYATCGKLKKKFLLVLEYLRYYSGRIGVK